MDDARRKLINEFFGYNSTEIVSKSIAEARTMMGDILHKARCPLCTGKIYSIDTERVLFECGHYLGKW